MEKKKITKTTIPDSQKNTVLKSKHRFPAWVYTKRAYVISAGVLLILIIILFLMSQSPKTTFDTSMMKTDRTSSQNNESPTDHQTVFPWQQNGIVCSEVSDFSFQMQNPYQIVMEGSEGIAINDTSGFLVTVRKSDSDPTTEFLSFLDQSQIPYTQTVDSFTYTLPADKDPDNSSGPVSAISRIRDSYIVSVFYNPGEENNADAMSQTVVNTITEGCDHE